MANEEKIKIIVEKDGVYLQIDNTFESGRPRKMDVLNIIEEYGVLEIDFVAISDLLKQSDDVAKAKISSNTKTKQEPETAKISLDENSLNAYITFSPPVRGGAKMTVVEIVKLLEANNIRFGMDQMAILDLVKNKNKNYDVPYCVASGTKPEEGTDGSLKFLVDISKRNLKPRELPNGKVDYRNLDLFEVAAKGQKLVEALQMVTGKDGLSVHNTPILARKTKPAPPLPRGKNTSPTPDDLFLVSEINGQVVLEGKRLNVLPVLEIRGNVDNSTGDIHFNGAIVIHGNVLPGFCITADGGIEVHGVVEGATIESKENIVIKSGVQGQEKAIIKAGGNIHVKYAENCTLQSGGDIFADSIMHSQVKCGKSIELKGKSGLLVGGKIIVGKTVFAKVIGSAMATVTEIEAGFVPDVLLLYKEYMVEYNLKKAEFDKTSTIVQALSKQNEESPLPEDKKRILLKTVHTKMFIREQLVAMQEKINELLPLMSQGAGKVVVEDVIRPGVKLTIGNAALYVRDDIHYCTFTNVDSKIFIGPF